MQHFCSYGANRLGFANVQWLNGRFSRSLSGISQIEKETEGGRRQGEEGAEGSEKRGARRDEEDTNLQNLHFTSAPAFSQGPDLYRF